MRIVWDKEKSRILKLNPSRATSFEEAKIILEDLDRDIGGGIKSTDPEQHFAIGFASNGKLITLIYEYRFDQDGPYIRLVTLWKTTKQEKRMANL